MHLVTGGCGFFGSEVVRSLINQGEAVRVIDIWKDPTLPKEVQFVLGDVRNESLVSEAMRGVHIVHHTAALVPLTKSGNEFWDTNVRGTETIARCALRASVEKIIHLSSSAVYGLPQELPITEETPHQPIEVYGKSKSDAEKIAQEIFENEKQRLVIIRPRTILGQGRLGIFQTLFAWIQQGYPIYTIGSGEILFQFVHARDLLNAYMSVVASGMHGSFNVGTEEFGTLNDVFYETIKYANSKSRVLHLPEKSTIAALAALDRLKLSPLAPWHYLTYHKDFYFDLTRIKSTGWHSKFSNKEMFLESYESYLASLRSKSGRSLESAHRKGLQLGLLGVIANLLKRSS
jgi:nucleoside-diphosphate-sugar epimerase